MANVAVIYCKKLKDYLCVGCSKCFDAVRQRTGEFARYESVELVALTDCGDCPGLVVPRVALLVADARTRGCRIDAVHLAPCISTALEVSKCPLRIEEAREELQSRFGIQMVLGPHGPGTRQAGVS